MHRTTWGAAALAGALCLVLAAPARADNLDLSAGGQGTINGAIYTTNAVQPAGTGVIHSFLRLQTPNGTVFTEQGYNTDGRLSSPVRGPFDENTDPNFTRSLTLGLVPIVTIGGVEYRVFHLDINEPSANGKKYISLTDLKIYISPAGNLTTTNLADGGPLGDMIYDLDGSATQGDSLIKLNTSFLGPGSGISDMVALIPNSLFGVAGSGAYITLYSKFGSADYEAQGGFEEWFTYDDGTGRVPEPALAVLVGIALGLVAARRKR